jgi:hypothetical protein
MLRNLFDPVKLLKGIVEIGRKKTSHWPNSRPRSIRPTLVVTDNQFPESPVGLGVQATITDCGGHWIRS